LPKNSKVHKKLVPLKKLEFIGILKRPEMQTKNTYELSPKKKQNFFSGNSKRNVFFAAPKIKP